MDFKLIVWRQEKDSRVVGIIDQMDAEGFGSCTFIGECEVACSKDIPILKVYSAVFIAGH